MKRVDEISEIERRLATHGTTRLPDSAAYMLGESSPGWRHGTNNSASQFTAKITGKASSILRGQRQARLARKIGAPQVIHAVEYKKQRHTKTHTVICRYFDKVCHVCWSDDQEKMRSSAARFNKLYSVVGARFEVVEGKKMPTFCSWKVTVKPLLSRQIARAAHKAQ